MNWNKIFKLALILFVAQVVLGFVEGAVSSPSSGASWLSAGHLASFVVCSAIFAFFAMREPARPFVHAWIGLLLQVFVAVALSAALVAWLGSAPWASVAMEWVVLVAALVVGTSVGIGLRHSSGKPADA